jgi:aryl-alcohol dehydrogenase-like predicted oxidoreductase
MPLNHYVSLGNSGLRVSPFCLGAMTFGEDWGFGSGEAESKQVLDRYLDRGGNFIDTANVYTKGHSEKILGDHIGRTSSRRDRVVIATKFFGSMFSGDPNGGGASRKSLTSACEQSLRRLQTDYIDLYWLHCWDSFTPIEETMRALDDLVAAGKVRYIGFSDTPAWKVTQAHVIAQMRGWTPLIALQLEYSLLERTIEGELVPAALELGMGITPWSPLRSGVLTGKYTRENSATAAPSRGTFVTRAFSEEAFRVVDVLVDVAKKLGTTPARAALAWVQAQPGVTSTIIGARTMEQLDDNLGGLDVTLSAEQLKALDEVSRPKLNFPYDFVRNSAGFGHSGATVNGVTAPVNPLAPTSDAERY